ncbi:MAG: hypothetical protein E7661_10775 [Ruminococcaceae bacterium]|nr:hypothetical protein [Oscillospiraceae bacterium]
MRYCIEIEHFKLDYTPETSAFTVTLTGQEVVWKWANDPFLVVGGKSLAFSTAKCESRVHDTGVSRGVRAIFTEFKDEDGHIYPYTVETYVSIDTSTGYIKAEAHVTGDQRGEISTMAYPPRMKFDAPEGHGYTVLPRMQGTLIPAGHPEKLKDGLVFERDAYIPVYGQIKDGYGYTAIFDTPYDARYSVVGEEIQPYFVPSLGTMRYPRAMLYDFFAEGDFNTVAKTYRAYLTERGQLKTLKEKMTRNPKIEYLLGCPIVHSGTAVHIHPASHFYDKEHPENNDTYFPFAENGKLLRKLKENGANKVYLHLDGWGHHGYDNLHPDPFPIHEASGGAEGMKALQETCTELGYYFGIHDQYRDYYYDAPSFDLDNAVTYIDGSHPYHDYWNGGPHSFLCAKLAVDYVRRNYDEFERLGIKLDGSYLDVFSVVELDECFNPHHPMTREECASARAHCLELLTDRGIIPSSEETIGCMVNSIALCHHAPFYTTDWEDRNALNVGIPIPFFNLVYHDCVIIPWYGIHQKGAWGIAGTDRGFYWALLCGGTIYYDVDASAEDIAYGKVALELHRHVALCELTSHELIDGHPRRRRSVFSDGTVVECDFDAEAFTICYPDGTVVEGH